MQTDFVHASDYLLFLYWAVIVRRRYEHWCHYCCQMNSLIVWSKPPQKSPLVCPRKRFTPGSTSILPSVSRIPKGYLEKPHRIPTESPYNTYRNLNEYVQKPHRIYLEKPYRIPTESPYNTYRNLNEYLQKPDRIYLEKPYRIPTEILQNTYRNLTEYLEKAYRIPTESPLMFLKSKTDEDWSLFVSSTCMIMCRAVFIYKFL